MGSVFVAPLSWGLGHATRDMPLIETFLRHGHRVTIGTSGPALHLLRREFPACDFVDFPDYPAPYTRSRFFVARFAAFVPAMLAAIRREHLFFTRWLAGHPCDLVVSDNRFGVYAPGRPSFFISHQLRFHVPAPLWPAGGLSEFFNGAHHRHFTRVIVPDNADPARRLSGRLSINRRSERAGRVFFAGILCAADAGRVPAGAADIDYLALVSGPEPQRRELERIVLAQVPRLPGRKVIVLGRPAEEFARRPGRRTLVLAHASRPRLNRLMRRARFVIARPGYTTMMELAELGLRHALFIPTPGQTEQEYLARYYRRRGWFLSRSQYRVDLARDVPAAAAYRGFPAMSRAAENAAGLYQALFAPCF